MFLEKAGMRVEFKGDREHKLHSVAWDAYRKGKDYPTVSYVGKYADAVEQCEQWAVHVNASSSAYSAGQVEYTTMEAIDAGCTIIAPKHVSHPDFQMVALDWLHEPGNLSSIKKDNTQAMRLEQEITAALERWETQDPQGIADDNRAALQRMHSPQRVALQVLERIR
jgi:hypothetical protein